MPKRLSSFGRVLWTNEEKVVKGGERVDGKFGDAILQEETRVIGAELGIVEDGLDDTPLGFKTI